MGLCAKEGSAHMAEAPHGQPSCQGRAHDYRGAAAQSQKRAVCALAQHVPKHFPGVNNTICR